MNKIRITIWNYDYLEYESSGDRNKNILVIEYLDKIKPYLRDITINLQEADTWKIELTILQLTLFLLKMLMKSV